jgi:polyvinyl alcohol dehydrogenase (cytochrome)
MRITRARIAAGTAVLSIALTGVLALGGPASGATPSTWSSAGQDIQNTRSQPGEREIGVGNVGSLAPKWTFTTSGDVSATPAVDSSRVYVSDWGGHVYAIDRATGAELWSTTVSSVTGVANDYARNTPAIAGNVLILGNQGAKFATPTTPIGQRGAWVFGLNKNTGALLWKTQIESQFSAIVTQSAVVKGGVAYVGAASNEEAFAADPTYTCCNFIGSVSALDVNTGALLWKTLMAPPAPPGWDPAIDGPWYSGAAVWGSTPAIDAATNSLYITTGATKWVYRALPDDFWNVACGIPPFIPPGPNCPDPEGPDFDFGQGPALFQVKINGKVRNVIGAGQKSGDYTLLDRVTGAVIWKTHVGAGGLLGGLQWGSATDGKRIYVAKSNSADAFSGVPGYWAALDAATGAVLWTTNDPFYAFTFSAQGAVSVANGVVYACTLDAQGHMLAMNAATGQILWSFPSGGACNSGAAIVDGTVYWGSGYSFLGTPNNKLYAFGVS